MQKKTTAPNKTDFGKPDTTDHGQQLQQRGQHNAADKSQRETMADCQHRRMPAADPDGFPGRKNDQRDRDHKNWCCDEKAKWNTYWRQSVK